MSDQKADVLLDVVAGRATVNARLRRTRDE